MKLSDADIGDGDLLLFEGRSIFGRLIKLRTRSRFSHVAIAVKLAGRLFVIEALEGWGVRLWPLPFYLNDCEDRGIRVHWYRLKDGIGRQAVVSFALAQVGKRYASPWQFFVSWGRLTGWIRRLFGWKQIDTNAERYCCSELAAAALRAGGYVPDPEDDLDPAATDPGSIALARCLDRQGVLVS